MAHLYPIELKLMRRPVLVVGGGRVAARKISGLLDAGAVVRVVSPSFVPEILEKQEVKRIETTYSAEHVADASLVFACTGDHSLNAAVAQDARRMGVWCNVVDDPDSGDFQVPAVLRQGDMTIAVSTGGASPALAVAVRDRLSSHFGPEWGILIEELARAREVLKTRVADPAIRRQILDTLCSDCSMILLTTRDREAWRNWLERVTEYRLHGLAQASDGL
jgi:precorrin-2 dehydrogenase / sirohydrochlorin ferrochelatase